MPQSILSEAGLQVYLCQISRFALLSEARELQLARQLTQSGDQAAREELVVSNLRLVVHIAKGYLQRGLPLHDLIEEGNVGLIKAVDGFDPEMNVRLSTYAAFWIKQALRRAVLNTARTVRLPVGVAEMLARLNRAASEFEQRFGTAPQLPELAKETGVSVRKIGRLQRAAASRSIVSDSQTSEKDQLLDDIACDEKAQSPEDQVVQQEQLSAMQTALDGMNAREARVIRMRYGLGADRSFTLEEVGQELGIKRESVRQIQDKALRRLHVALSAGAPV